MKDWANIYARVAVEEAREGRRRARDYARERERTVASHTSQSRPTCLASYIPSWLHCNRLSGNTGPIPSASTAAASSASSDSRAGASAVRRPVPGGIRPRPGNVPTGGKRPRRPVAASHAAFARLSLFLAPLAVVLAFFLGLHFSADATITSIQKLTEFAALAAARVSAARKVSMSTASFITSVGHPSQLAAAHETLTSTLLLLRALEEQLTSGTNARADPALDGGRPPPALRFNSPGAEREGPAGLSPRSAATLQALLFGNLCNHLTTLDAGLPFNATACEAFDDGRLLQGASVALKALQDTARILMSRRAQATIANISSATGTRTYTPQSRLNFTTGGAGLNLTGPASLPAVTEPYLVWDEIHSDAYNRMVALRSYLLPALNAVADIYVDACSGVAEAYHTQALRAYVGVTFALLLLGMAGLYLPAIRRMDAGIRQEQALLLLLPVPVLDATPSVTTMIREILVEREKHAGLGGGGAIINVAAPVGTSAANSGAAAAAGHDTEPASYPHH